MPRSLLFRLVGAFALVILALAVVVAILVNRATAGQFQLYSDRNGRLWAAKLVPQLADYYLRQGSWQGIESVLPGPAQTTMAGGGMMGTGGMGMTPGAMSASEMWTMMGLRVVLVDSRGLVIGDSAELLTGQALPAAVLATGETILTGHT